MADHRGWQEQADAFEAYQIFRTVKNVFFWLLLIGLLVMQCAFWLIDQGVMDTIREKAPDLESWVQSIIVICYVAVTFSAVIYCLSLWMGLNLALVGRLSGLANASKAFFLSLILLIFAVPWQRIFNLEIPGALFTYEQAFNAYSTVRTEDEFLQLMLYYSRFVALWVIAIIVLIAAQRCSAQAGKMISRSIARYAERGPTNPPEPPLRL
jgi:hypothetical protein